MSLKYWDDAESTTLWAFSVLPWADNEMSTNSSFSSRALKEVVTLRPKLFHFRQYLEGAGGPEPSSTSVVAAAIVIPQGM